MKIHLVQSSLPLKAGVAQTAECGRVVSNCVFPFIFDLDYQQAASLNSMLICGTCYAKKSNGAGYLYGLVNGQEAMIGAEVEA